MLQHKFSGCMLNNKQCLRMVQSLIIYQGRLSRHLIHKFVSIVGRVSVHMLMTISCWFLVHQSMSLVRVIAINGTSCRHLIYIHCSCFIHHHHWLQPSHLLTIHVMSYSVLQMYWYQCYDMHILVYNIWGVYVPKAASMIYCRFLATVTLKVRSFLPHYVWRPLGSLN